MVHPYVSSTKVRLVLPEPKLESSGQKMSMAGPLEAVLKPGSAHHLMFKTPMTALDSSGGGGVPIPSVFQTHVGSYKGSHK
jgi:hypothetical protein